MNKNSTILVKSIKRKNTNFLKCEYQLSKKLIKEQKVPMKRNLQKFAIQHTFNWNGIS